MDEGKTPLDPVEILPKAEARKRYLTYVAVKLVGLAALFGGVFLLRDGGSAAGYLLMAAGAATLFVRPRMLGLTTGSRRPKR